MIIVLCFLLPTPLALSISSDQINFYHLPGIHQTVYSQLGDINIGALVVTDQGSAEACSQQTRLIPKTIEQTEAFTYAIDFINRSPDILPNVTLGFIIRGICGYLGPAIASSLLFIPRNKRLCSHNDTECSGKSLDSNWLSHDVIGMLSMGSSSLTLSLSPLYAVANLPILGATETSDEFSNKKYHPYFFRIAPPQMYQVQAILKFIKRNGWSYISVLYSNCGFSLTTAIESIDKYGICIATMHKLSSSTNYDEVITDLLMNPRARVIVLFVSSSQFADILKAVVRQNASKHFIWIGSNIIDSYRGITTEEEMAKDPAIGTIYFDTYSKDIPQFFDHLSNLNASESKNPWLKPVWEYILDCSLDKGSCGSNADIVKSGRYRTYKGTSLRIDAILTLAHAAHDLISDRCPEARGEDARACVTGELLRQYLKNVSFDGFVGPVTFDENQDVKGKYSIKQLVYERPHFGFLSNSSAIKKRIFGKMIGTFDISTDKFTFIGDKISWDHLNTLERIVPWNLESMVPQEVPESVCSRPCLVGEYKIEKKVSCCWECRRCREYERLVDGNTSCETCPSFTWPDPHSEFTTCVDLPLTYSNFGDPIPIALTSMAVLALVVTISVFIMYITHRNERVIKASSRELSVIQLFAIFTGYTTVVLFQTAPSYVMCRAIFFLFCMSFSLLYCPLLVKAIRIFRIFKSGTKNKRPIFISPESQLTFSALLITIQMVLCAAAYMFYPPNSRRIQPIWTEKLVELSCDLTLLGLSSFLGYNLILVSLCSVFAFLTRKLPDNFNESKFISMCVSTTLLIWLAFIPTYFTAQREFVRVFLLSVALLLNHSVALVFLFVPKLYAAVFLPSEDGKFSQNRN